MPNTEADEKERILEDMILHTKASIDFVFSFS